MSAPGIRSLGALREEMKAMARADRPTPADALRTSFNSSEALLRLLTPANRALLALIRGRKPDAIAALAELSSRAEPNLTRTVAALEGVGLVAGAAAEWGRELRATVWKLRVDIDPYSCRGTVEIV